MKNWQESVETAATDKAQKNHEKRIKKQEHAERWREAMRKNRKSPAEDSGEVDEEGDQARISPCGPPGSGEEAHRETRGDVSPIAAGQSGGEGAGSEKEEVTMGPQPQMRDAGREPECDDNSGPEAGGASSDEDDETGDPSGDAVAGVAGGAESRDDRDDENDEADGEVTFTEVAPWELHPCICQKPGEPFREVPGERRPRCRECLKPVNLRADRGVESQVAVAGSQWEASAGVADDVLDDEGQAPNAGGDVGGGDGQSSGTGTAPERPRPPFEDSLTINMRQLAALGFGGTVITHVNQQGRAIAVAPMMMERSDHQDADDGEPTGQGNRSHGEDDERMAAALAESAAEAEERWADVPVEQEMQGVDRGGPRQAFARAWNMDALLYTGGNQIPELDQGKPSGQDDSSGNEEVDDDEPVRRPVPWTDTDSSSEEDDGPPTNRNVCDRRGSDWKWASTIPTCLRCWQRPNYSESMAVGADDVAKP